LPGEGRKVAECSADGSQGVGLKSLRICSFLARRNSRLAHIRVGGLDGRLYLDLGDETWRAVEIDATGWRVIDNPPVRFRRASGMKPMPIPMSGGSVERLRSFLNVQSDADFVLVVAWALASCAIAAPIR
jgi:hypothetical protein